MPAYSSPVRRIALVFTAVIFAALLGGLLSRRESSDPAPVAGVEAETPLALPRLADPLNLAQEAGAARANRLQVLVVDPRGAPIVGAALVLRSGSAPLWAMTDGEGRARLDGMSAGPSRLAVIAFPHPNLEIDVEASPDERRIEMGEAATPPPPLPAILRSDVVGRLDPASADWIDCEVMLLPSDGPTALGGVLPRVAKVSADGSFRFDQLAHGTYRVQLLPPWAAGGTWPDLAAVASRQVQHPATGPWVLATAAGAIEGEVRDALGRALEGALVLTTALDDESRVWPPRASGPDGRFRVADLPPGRYRVVCKAGEGGSSLDVSVVAGEVAWAALPPFAARKQR